jgi:plastocyanin
VKRFVRAACVAVAVVAGIGLLGGFGHTSRAAQTFTVNVDGHNPKVNEAFIGYYPSTVRVHPGDTVVFHEVGNGEPHTVTLGTITDKIVAAFDKLTPKQQQGTPPKSFIRLDANDPQLLPQGPGDAIQSASNPCYLNSGAPPKKGACAKAAEPDFTGKESFYNSGWLDSKAKFTIHLSSSIAPGTYRFMCLLHREGMTGKVVVIPSSTSVPSPSAQYAAGQKTLQATEAKLQPAATALGQGKPPIPVKLPGAHPALAGSGSQAVGEAAVTEFGPSKIHIPVGGSVTWYFIGVHTITFNSNKTDDDIRTVAPNGTVHLNPKALAPAKSPGEPAPKGGGGSGSAVHFKVVASTKWDGAGFLNSGIFANSNPPSNIEGYTITFTKAGKYKYICTVHDDMKGEVDVG